MLQRWLLLLNFRQMAPLYKPTLLNLVIIYMSSIHWPCVQKNHEIIFCTFLDIWENAVAPFILVHPVVKAQLYDASTTLYTHKNLFVSVSNNITFTVIGKQEVFPIFN